MFEDSGSEFRIEVPGCQNLVKGSYMFVLVVKILGLVTLWFLDSLLNNPGFS